MGVLCAGRSQGGAIQAVHTCPLPSDVQSPEFADLADLERLSPHGPLRGQEDAAPRLRVDLASAKPTMRGLSPCARLLLQAPGVGSRGNARRCRGRPVRRGRQRPITAAFAPPLLARSARGRRGPLSLTLGLPLLPCAIAAPAPGPSPAGSDAALAGAAPGPPGGGAPPAPAAAGGGEGHSINFWILGGLLFALAAVLLLGVHQQMRWWRRQRRGAGSTAAAAAPHAGAGEAQGRVGLAARHAVGLRLGDRCYVRGLRRGACAPHCAQLPCPTAVCFLPVQAAARRASRPPWRRCGWPR